ncbi:hypothetical protein Q7P37_005456 [Cladosporium fusiforme]
MPADRAPRERHDSPLPASLYILPAIDHQGTPLPKTLLVRPNSARKPSLPSIVIGQHAVPPYQHSLRHLPAILVPPLPPGARTLGARRSSYHRHTIIRSAANHACSHVHVHVRGSAKPVAR